MPWPLLLRLLSGLLFWRLAARRRATAARARGAAAASSPTLERRLREAREMASLMSRLLIVAGFALATSLCLAAGTTTAVLSPRWLGAVLLAIATVFAVLTIREARVARGIVQARRLRRRDRRVRAEL